VPTGSLKNLGSGPISAKILFFVLKDPDHKSLILDPKPDPEKSVENLLKGEQIHYLIFYFL